jgi:hypothetical protein
VKAALHLWPCRYPPLCTCKVPDAEIVSAGEASKEKKVSEKDTRKGFFDYEGKTYALDFYRRRHEVEILVPDNYELNDAFLKNGKHYVKRESTYPATTARLLEVKFDAQGNVEPKALWPVAHSATVGCFIHDTYSAGAGRIFALKKLTKDLPGPFKGAIFSAYANR